MFMTYCQLCVIYIVFSVYLYNSDIDRTPHILHDPLSCYIVKLESAIGNSRCYGFIHVGINNLIKFDSNNPKF